MATAAPEKPTTETASAGNPLLAASLLAGLVLITGAVAVGYALPKAIDEIMPSTLASTLLRAFAQIAAFGGLVWLIHKLAGDQPPRGLRGGIFIVISILLTVFFLWRALTLNFTEGFGMYVAIAFSALIVFVGFKLLISNWFKATSVNLEDMGWFHTFSYKRTQGVRMRRYTIIGILLVGISGVWALINNGSLDSPMLTLQIPYLDKLVPVVAGPSTVVPLLMVGIVLWIAWRAVNVPVFADFLIATEAEMNKVSWTPKRRLFQDTVVVLVTTLLLTAFLLVIDIFWGWLLSLSFVGVLPSKDKLEQLKSQSRPVEKRWEPDLNAAPAPAPAPVSPTEPQP